MIVCKNSHLFRPEHFENLVILITFRSLCPVIFTNILIYTCGRNKSDY